MNAGKPDIVIVRNIYVIILFLSPNIEENVWQEMIDEADLDKDGEINFQDFKGIMEQC